MHEFENRRRKQNQKIMKQTIFKSTIAIATLFFIGFSCSKDEQTADTTNGEKGSEIESVINGTIEVSNDGLDGNVDGIANGRTDGTAGCGTVSNDATAKVLTIDFGAGCTGVDGRTRKGKISIQYVGAIPQTSPTRTLTFINYSVNNNSITGSISISGFQRTTSSLTFSVSATNAQVVLSDGRTYAISTLQRTFTSNFGVLTDLTDDVTTITGNSTQTGPNGNVTTINITSPITIKGSCATTGFYYPASGTYEVIDGKVTYTIDWGTGTCDKLISITAFGKTTVKTLP